MVRFAPRKLFDNRITVLIPEHFTDMPPNIAEFRYLSRYRPPVLLTDESFSVNLAFHLLERDEMDLEQTTAAMQSALLRQAQETVVYDNGVIKTEQSEGRWFEYKNFTLSDETYHIQSLIYLKPYLLISMFNCRMVHFDEWKQPILKSFGYTKLNEEI